VLSLLIAQIVTLLVSIVGLQREGMRWVWRGIDALWKESRFRSVFSALLFAYLLAQVYVVCELHHHARHDAGAGGLLPVQCSVGQCAHQPPGLSNG